MKKVLILSFYSLLNDQRIRRQIHWLKDDYEVSTVSAGPSEIAGVANHILPFRQKSIRNKIKRGVYYKLGFFEENYWDNIDFQRLNRELGEVAFDMIIANDHETLPLAFKLARSAKILFDAHEYSPAHFDSNRYWRFFFKASNRYICRKYIPRCHAMTTVSSGLARLYRNEFAIEPIVITNAADYCDSEPSPVNKDKIRILTHGNATPYRRLELMIESMAFVDDRFQFDLMLMPTDRKYYAKLIKKVRSYRNVRIIPPVPASQIIAFSRSYDLAFLVFRPLTMNFKFGLFNKYFESIQARLGIIAGPYPLPQAELTRKYRCGIVIQEYAPRAIGKAVNGLSADDVSAFKMNAHKAAGELSSKRNSEVFKQLADALLGNREKNGSAS